MKTPNRSIIKPLEAGSITPSAIEELSSQIDSLLQRGRRLRDLKNSMSRSPHRTLRETRDSAFDPHSTSIGFMDVPDPLEDVLALINASDPLFSEEARVPPKAASEPVPKFAQTKPLPSPTVSMPKPAMGRPCSYTIGQSYISDRRVVLRLRSKSDVSAERVSDETDSEIAVEAWRGSDLVGIGRKQGDAAIPSKISVDIWDVWEGTLVGKVIIEVGLFSDLNVSESPPILSETSIIGPVPELITTPSISFIPEPPIPSVPEPLHAKPFMKPPVIERSVQSSPRVPPPALRLSTESIVSFLSESPNRKEEELIVSEDSDFDEDLSMSNLSRVMEEEVRAQVQSELSSASDLREVLQKKMKELDLITSRLVDPASPKREIRVEPVSETQAEEEKLPEPDIKEIKKTKRIGTRRRRRRVLLPFISNHNALNTKVADCVITLEPSPEKTEKFQFLQSEPLLETARSFVSIIEARQRPKSALSVQTTEKQFMTFPVTESVNDCESESSRNLSTLSKSNLSVVRSSLVAIGPPRPTVVEDPPTLPSVRLSSKRKESIERARKTISNLRQSFLKDVAALTQEQ